MSAVLFLATVAECTVFESENIFLTHTGSVPGHKTGRQKKSIEQKPFKASEFSFQCFILKPQTSALLNPDHMYSPNASAQNIGTRCNFLRVERHGSRAINILNPRPFKASLSLSRMFSETFY